MDRSLTRGVMLRLGSATSIIPARNGSNWPVGARSATLRATARPMSGTAPDIDQSAIDRASLVRGFQLAEHAVHFVAGPGGKEQRVTEIRSSGGTDLEIPETQNDQRIARCGGQLPDQRAARRIERVNRAVAEVAHEQRVGQRSEAGWSERDRP